MLRTLPQTASTSSENFSKPTRPLSYLIELVDGNTQFVDMLIILRQESKVKNNYQVMTPTGIMMHLNN